MQWLMDHLVTILSCCLVLSEAAAVIVLLLFPSNKGISGIFAGLIKVLKALGAKSPTPPST